MPVPDLVLGEPMEMRDVCACEQKPDGGDGIGAEVLAIVASFRVWKELQRVDEGGKGHGRFIVFWRESRGEHINRQGAVK